MTLRMGPEEVLGVGRITVFGIWLVQITFAPIVLYSELPFALFSPVGVFRLLPEELYRFAVAPEFLVTFKAVLLLCCTLLVLGVRPFIPLAVFTSLLLLFYDGLMKGFNWYINHAQIGILLAAILLAVFPAADGLSIAGRKKPASDPTLYAAPMLGVALLLCFTYSFIGIHRVLHSPPAIFTGNAIVTEFAVQSTRYSDFGFEYGLLPLTYAALVPVMKVGFAITTLFEIFSPFCLVSTWFRRIWLLVIIPFHLMTLLMMNILFWENLLLTLVFVATAGYVLSWMRPAAAPERRRDLHPSL